MSRTTIDDLLTTARARLDRVEVRDLTDAVIAGALMVDIRGDTQRANDGRIPDAIFHPRNVLEWRADPASGHDDPRLSADLDRQIIVVCNEGYQSSLAAATLQDLGFTNATDLVGGFQAYASAGFPVARD
jgi:rhodanese-related sulfurtransferase